METQEFDLEPENIEEKIVTEVSETSWYEFPRVDRDNFEFLSMGQLVPLQRYGNTIISVNRFIGKCRILYNNSNSKRKLSLKDFTKKYNAEPSLSHNLIMLYCDRIAKYLNKGKPFEERVDVRFEFLPASLGYDRDCYKIIAERVKR